MRKIILLIQIFILLTSFSTPGLIYSENLKSSTTVAVKPGSFKLSVKGISEMKVKEFEKLAGKKFSLKEKISVKILQLKLKKDLKKQSSGKTPSKGKTAFILGLLGLILLVVPYASIAALPLAILAIIFGGQALKDNPKDTKAKTGIILGWVTLGLFIVFLIIALIWLASFANWFGG